MLALRPNSASTVTVRALDWNDYAAALLRPETVGSEPTPVDPKDVNASSHSCKGDRPESTPMAPTGNKALTPRVGLPPTTTGTCQLPVEDRDPTGGGSRGESWQGAEEAGTDSRCDEETEAWAEAGEDALGTPDVLLAADVVYDVRCGGSGLP